GRCNVGTGTTCGQTGNCVAGACEVPGTGVSCGIGPDCSAAGVFTAPSHCTGTGTCAMASTTDCAGMGLVCVEPGGCTTKGLGQACTADNQWTGNPGHCVDGHCCNSACTGACVSCNNSTGTCTPTAQGQVDPRNVCMDQGAASCGQNGKCDGSPGV